MVNATAATAIMTVPFTPLCRISRRVLRPFSPGKPRFSHDGLDPVEEISVLRHFSAELVVDELDLDGFLWSRNQRCFRSPSSKTRYETLRLFSHQGKFPNTVCPTSDERRGEPGLLIDSLLLASMTVISHRTPMPSLLASFRGAPGIARPGTSLQPGRTRHRFISQPLQLLTNA